jgi:hypothetical protein
LARCFVLTWNNKLALFEKNDSLRKGAH